MDTKTIPKIYLQWLETLNQGKQVELIEANEDGEEVLGGLELERVYVDDKEQQWFEFLIGNGAIRVPLKEIKAAIDYALDTVRSEKYYDRHIDRDDKKNT